MTRIPGFTCINENHENGRVYFSERENITLFEDTQEGEDKLAYYAWAGTWADHDLVPHSPVTDDPDEAIEWVMDRQDTTIIGGGYKTGLEEAQE